MTAKVTEDILWLAVALVAIVLFGRREKTVLPWWFMLSAVALAFALKVFGVI